MDYYKKLSPRIKNWIITKPFTSPQDVHCQKLFRDFSNIVQLLNLPIGSEILDLGMGSGWSSIWLAKFGYQVTGIDSSSEAVKIAQKKIRDGYFKCEFFQGNGEESNLFPEEKFDAVLLYDVLHHTSCPWLVLKNSYLWLKENGKILVVEPNLKMRSSDFIKQMEKDYGLKENILSLFVLKRMLVRAGFSQIQQFYPSPRAYSSSPLEFLKHIIKPLFQRLFGKYYHMDIWLLAQKIYERNNN